MGKPCIRSIADQQVIPFYRTRNLISDSARASAAFGLSRPLFHVEDVLEKNPGDCKGGPAFTGSRHLAISLHRPFTGTPSTTRK
jgi:hypothetical protein